MRDVDVLSSRTSSIPLQCRCVNERNVAPFWIRLGGATCYMNSILQQLFMLPQISEYILSVQDEGEGAGGTARTDDSNLFYQLQQAFGHLLESKLQYYSPESFWNVFRLWGQEINVREQQDAFDFFTALTDQIDEYLKSTQRDEIFHKQFEGIFCNQMICTNGCSHRYEGEEKFMALNVAVKVDSLKESLNQFVKGELLDGSNAVSDAAANDTHCSIAFHSLVFLRQVSRETNDDQAIVHQEAATLALHPDETVRFRLGE